MQLENKNSTMKLHLLALALMMSLMMSLMVGTLAQDSGDDDGANEGGADKEGTDEEGADEEGADEESADKEGADEEGANEEGADKEGANEEGADEEQMDLDLIAVTNSTQDEETVSDIIAKANQKIESRLMEGDIVVDRRRNAVSCFYCKWPKYGSSVWIFYRFDSSYSSSQKSLIRSAMRTIQSKTCVRFYEISHYWSNYVRHLYIFSGSGCWSYIGRQWWTRSQKLSLSKNGCLYTSTIQHELLHALGFAHEHSRSDRDSHVTILYDNISSNKKHNFRKYRTNNLYTPYDFNSVMQYYNYAWSKNGRPTLQSKRNPSLRFGHATEVSKYDILRVNRYYKC